MSKKETVSERNKILKEIKKVRNDIRNLEENLNVESSLRSKISRLERQIEMCCQLNNIILSEVVCAPIDGMLQFNATVNSGPVGYKIALKSEKFKKDSIPRVCTLKVEILDPYHKLEMHSWVRQCVRDSNIQLIFRGISEYADKFTLRENTLMWLARDFNQHFNISRDTDRGMYTIEATDPKCNFTFFECAWSIKWSALKYKMCNSFEFHLHEKAVTLSHNCRDILGCLTDEDISDLSLKESWKQLAAMVVAESEKMTSTKMKE